MGQVIPLTQLPQDRLRLALRNLEAALADQRSAVAEFKANLHGLQGSVQGLGGSLGEFLARLVEVEGELGTARDAALRLEQTAASLTRA